MSEPCQSCAALQAQIGALRAQVASMQQRINFLEMQVGMLMSGVVSTAVWIDRELEKPTMPRRDVLPYLSMRLKEVAANV